MRVFASLNCTTSSRSASGLFGGTLIENLEFEAVLLRTLDADAPLGQRDDVDCIMFTCCLQHTSTRSSTHRTVFIIISQEQTKILRHLHLK